MLCTLYGLTHWILPTFNLYMVGLFLRLKALCLQSLKDFSSYRSAPSKYTCTLTGVAQWVGRLPTKQKVTGSIPSQDTCLGCGPSPQLGAYERQLIDISLSHGLMWMKTSLLLNCFVFPIHFFFVKETTAWPHLMVLFLRHSTNFIKFSRHICEIWKTSHLF